MRTSAQQEAAEGVKRRLMGLHPGLGFTTSLFYWEAKQGPRWQSPGRGGRLGGTQRGSFGPKEPTQQYNHHQSWESLAEKIRTGNAKALLCLC